MFELTARTRNMSLDPVASELYVSSIVTVWLLDLAWRNSLVFKCCDVGPNFRMFQNFLFINPLRPGPNQVAVTLLEVMVQCRSTRRCLQPSLLG